MEKKEIKISLWTFYVLMAAMVILLGAVVISWMTVAKNNKGDNENLSTNNQNIVSQDTSNQITVKNSLITDWHFGFYEEDETSEIFEERYSYSSVANDLLKINITATGDVYLEVRDIDKVNEGCYGLQDSVEVNGTYQILGINGDEITESLIGIARREYETYLVLLFLDNNGDVYYYSDYGMDSTNLKVEKLPLNENVTKIKQAYYVSDGEKIYDVLLETQNGTLYSFEDIFRRNV